jgi:tetratricopeptide (TPR) repeat protein
LGPILIHTRRYEEAARVYDRFATITEGLAGDYPEADLRVDAANARAMKVFALIQTGDRGEVEQALRQLEAISDRVGAAARNTLAWQLATWPDPSLRDPARAVELARKAVELRPLASSIWNTLGAALYRAGDWSAAIEALEKSDSLEPDRYLAINGFFLAMAHRRRGEEDQARRCYDKAAAWMEERQSQNDMLKRFRAEAAALMGIDPSEPEPKSAAEPTRPPK